MGKKLVIALGGNALGNTPEEQLELVKDTAKAIVDLVKEGNDVIIGHGNGPQVGMINLAMDYAANGGAGTPSMPFPECGAMSQGYIGYHLQQAIQEELRRNKIQKGCAAIVTQVVVDAADEAFKNPTKPVGMFYDKETADQLAAEKGFTMKEDAGRGYRRVVPSPKPVRIVELDMVNQLVEAGNIVITVGGGGIPVTRQGNHLKGASAVIDKDFASCLIAQQVDADVLIILTAVEKCAINFGKPDQQWLDNITTEQARQYCKEGQFAPGSMLPKVEAAIKFAESAPGRRALITLLEKARDGIDGKTGTVITV